MNLHSVISLIIYSIPTVTALTAWMLLLVTFQQKITPVKQLLRKIALLYYSVTIVATFGIMIHPVSPELFDILSAFNYGALLVVPVSLYHLILTLTATKKQEWFPSVHYALPVLIMFVLLVWTSYIPHDIRLTLAKDRTATIVGYEAFSAFYHSRMGVRLVFNLVYLALILMRIRQYRKCTTSGKQLQQEKLSWARTLTLLSIATLLVAALGIVKSDWVYNSVFAVLAILLLTVFQIEFLCRFIGGHFPIPLPVMLKEVKAVPVVDTEDKNSGKQLDKRLFEQWVKHRKPFLNPGFGINDAVKELEVNRTYISGFINQTYGLSFPNYINKLRINELRRLLKLSSNQAKTAVDLFSRAGFGSYRSYLRAKEREENNPKSTRK